MINLSIDFYSKVIQLNKIIISTFISIFIDAPLIKALYLIDAISNKINF